MAVTLGDGLVGVTLLAGVALCSLGVYCYRRWNEPGTGPFAAVAVLFGVGGVAGGAVIIRQGTEVPDSVAPLWADIGLLAWAIAMVPWLVFALQYTGRYTEFRWRTVAALSVPVLGIYLLLGFQSIGVIEGNVVTQIFGTLALLYTFALVTVGSYLLLRTTYKYGHLSLVQGVSLTLAGIGPLIMMNSISTLAGQAGEPVVFGMYALSFVVPTVALTLAVFRYEMFESTPAAGALGERAIPRETDDLVFVVDQDDRVIKINETATETLDVSPADPLGNSFSSLVGRSVAELQATETVELETTVGTRKFDPQVSAFTDQHDRRLGSLVSLRDVTERELRKQRLEVLNRVLRHNLRNRVDVIKSNAEAVATETDSEYADAIHSSADGLATLSSKARSIDQLVSRPGRTSEADLASVARELAETSGDVTVDGPDSASLVTDWEALRSALESAIENAVEHADTSVTVTIKAVDDGYEIAVADDGPGIPDSELASLDAETETPLQHGTGLGLWQLKWSVTKLNGELAFDTTDGTTVRITVPDRAA
ncbi:ATP-binding protein [Salinibaculum salinum]|uniref:ATP-binding protein n=1 Tax=Salinibaculum salinum TaxID=3131996 RepID=UPI0030EF2D0E